MNAKTTWVLAVLCLILGFLSGYATPRQDHTATNDRMQDSILSTDRVIIIRKDGEEPVAYKHYDLPAEGIVRIVRFAKDEDAREVFAHTFATTISEVGRVVKDH